jgi:hypothetical protein
MRNGSAQSSARRGGPANLSGNTVISIIDCLRVRDKHSAPASPEGAAYEIQRSRRYPRPEPGQYFSQGACCNFESGWKGDPLCLIENERHTDFIGAVRFGCDYAGIAFDRQGKQEDPAARRAREAEQERQRAEREAALRRLTSIWKATRVRGGVREGRRRAYRPPSADGSCL